MKRSLTAYPLIAVIATTVLSGCVTTAELEVRHLAGPATAIHKKAYVFTAVVNDYGDPKFISDAMPARLLAGDSGISEFAYTVRGQAIRDPRLSPFGFGTKLRGVASDSVTVYFSATGSYTLVARRFLPGLSPTATDTLHVDVQ